MTTEQLFALSSGSDAQPLHLPSSLTLWARFEWRTRERPRSLHAGADLQHEVPAPSAPPVQPAQATLRETEHQAVVRVLAKCEGHVSRAARALGVSRELIHRHLQKARG